MQRTLDEGRIIEGPQCFRCKGRKHYILSRFKNRHPDRDVVCPNCLVPIAYDTKERALFPMSHLEYSAEDLVKAIQGTRQPKRYRAVDYVQHVFEELPGWQASSHRG